MYNAIQARYAGPTNTRPGRILVRSAAGRSVHDWDYSLSREANYGAAVAAHARKIGWDDRPWSLGMLDDGSVVAVTP
jgi:hypothetical protein